MEETQIHMNNLSIPLFIREESRKWHAQVSPSGWRLNKLYHTHRKEFYEMITNHVSEAYLMTLENVHSVKYKNWDAKLDSHNVILLFYLHIKRLEPTKILTTVYG